MIFINSRPVDEQAMHINDMHRRRSSLHPKQPPTSTCNSAKLGVLTSIVYLVLSAVCIVLHYPLSLLCILVPALVLFFILAAIRRKKQIDVWTATFLATLGIFIKGAAIITYLSVFDVSPIGEQRKKGDTALHPKSIFIIVVLMCEILALIAAICLKWHLVAFRADPELVAVVNQKRKESRVMSNASYAS
ncbi:hypothetical protein PRIPAC_71134 [Pristionchus pacificus]|uniref:Uncharacterized protein n=1 Tax=Pristionchus pacificus TaxID=54126 RepID=A0A2A6C071_PRIPA|nr:hypothetical protein PRIPAC_71134 [Pristionchus pacificus]|eukprot:PDM71509.1 hypothetical protein PRIPAC_37916 [Pristionchus pacificus]